jgi:hypothetical protein
MRALVARFAWHDLIAHLSGALRVAEEETAA